VTHVFEDSELVVRIGSLGQRLLEKCYVFAYTSINIKNRSQIILSLRIYDEFLLE